jgi:hydroxymethylpyrimidine pyrophosphatase-like HAD family hydrolase
MSNPVTAKLIALDIDGTLLSSTLTVLPKTKAALQAVAARGHHVVLASSRSSYRLASSLVLAGRIFLEIIKFSSSKRCHPSLLQPLSS